MNILISSIEFERTIISMDRDVLSKIIVNYKITNYPNNIEGQYFLSSKTTVIDLDKIKKDIIDDIKNLNEE